MQQIDLERLLLEESRRKALQDAMQSSKQNQQGQELLDQVRATLENEQKEMRIKHEEIRG